MHRDDQANSTGSPATISGSPEPGGGPSFEAAIASIWQTLLGLPQISIDDNFFEVGGTSLLATILLKRVNEAFRQNLHIATVFEHTTIRSLASLLRGEAAPNSNDSDRKSVV